MPSTEMDHAPSEMDHASKRRFYSYGTARIFEKRANQLAWRRQVITYLGIAVPLLVGALIRSIGTEVMPYLVKPAAVILVFQLAFSAWSIVARWDEKYHYARSALQSQTQLFNKWNQLATGRVELSTERIRAIDEEDQKLEQADLGQHIRENEKRYAMRSSLFYFKTKCATCNSIPGTMRPSKCDTCGNY